MNSVQFAIRDLPHSTDQVPGFLKLALSTSDAGRPSGLQTARACRVEQLTSSFLSARQRIGGIHRIRDAQNDNHFIASPFETMFCNQESPFYGAKRCLTKDNLRSHCLKRRFAQLCIEDDRSPTRYDHSHLLEWNAVLRCIESIRDSYRTHLLQGFSRSKVLGRCHAEVM